MSAIRIVRGVYRNKAIQNQVFTLVSGFQTGAKGGYVTVENDGTFPNCPDSIRIKVENISDIEYTSGETVQENTVKFKPTVVAETDEQAMDRIRERFDILHEMTKACVSGDIRAMIVSGPPGVGKSYGVEQEIDKACLFDKLASKRLKAEVVKGSASPIGLYQTLYKYSDPNCVLVFDDCDSILLDDVALNLLKGALDSGKKRKISWLSDSRILRSESRCHYLDLTLDTMRDKVLRIKQIAKDGVLFADYDFDECVQDEIIAFMDENKNRLREMSLRMALKIADLRKMSVLNWKRLAETTVMKPAGA